MNVSVEMFSYGPDTIVSTYTGDTLDDIKVKIMADVSEMTRNIIKVRISMHEYKEVLLSETVRILRDYNGNARAHWANFTPNQEYLQARKIAPMTADMVLQMVLGSDEVLDELTDIIILRLQERGLL